ncbi:MAG: outer membrane lipoprotein-sorting protein [Blastocatellia bacterium]|nr:outer membrane lipoprotein-sorting protein [Blastocatellia bacterium]
MMRVVPLLLVCLVLSACGRGADSPDVKKEGAAPAASAPLPDIGKMIARVATQDGCRDFTAEMRVTAEDAAGQRDQVEFKVQRKYSPSQAVTFLTVLAPREESDKAILAIERADQATEAFSYLAGLKRLAKMNSERQLGFRNAKVTVQELLGMELGQYAHSAGERVADGGGQLIRVEFKAKPDRSLAFPRIVGYFNEKELAPSRFELYDARDELQKRVAIEEVKAVQNRQTITRVAIDDVLQKLKLQLETRRIEYDRGISDAIFTENYLKSHITSAGKRLIQ